MARHSPIPSGASIGIYVVVMSRWKSSYSNGTAKVLLSDRCFSDTRSQGSRCATSEFAFLGPLLPTRGLCKKSGKANFKICNTYYTFSFSAQK
jgi:hypothetical protein